MRRVQLLTPPEERKIRRINPHAEIFLQQHFLKTRRVEFLLLCRAFQVQVYKIFLRNILKRLMNLVQNVAFCVFLVKRAGHIRTLAQRRPHKPPAAIFRV